MRWCADGPSGVPVAAETSAKERAWLLFDHIIAQAAPDGEHADPWTTTDDGRLRFSPDIPTLERLLGVPLLLRAGSQTGVPALALDVWLSYELRRAGFDPDAVWPRATHPRILPTPIAKLLAGLPAAERDALTARLTQRTAIPGATAASANILGKHYLKQVDVMMTDWATGPELLISTKRMDSSYGKNAANRVEESYGDAKNLRLRHPLAALGFVLGLRSDILETAPATADWLFDLVGKLGQEDDAYHATSIIIFDYTDPRASGTLFDDAAQLAPGGDLDAIIDRLPEARVRDDVVADWLSPGRFLTVMVNRVLDATPVTFHPEARRRRSAARNSAARLGSVITDDGRIL